MCICVLLVPFTFTLAFTFIIIRSRSVPHPPFVWDLWFFHPKPCESTEYGCIDRKK
jgi:hypothetical protein